MHWWDLGVELAGSRDLSLALQDWDWSGVHWHHQTRSVLCFWPCGVYEKKQLWFVVQLLEKQIFGVLLSWLFDSLNSRWKMSWWLCTLGGWNRGMGMKPKRGNSEKISPLFWPCRSLTLQNSFTAYTCEPWFFGLCGGAPVLCLAPHMLAFLSLCLFCDVLGHTRPWELVWMAESEDWMRV